MELTADLAATELKDERKKEDEGSDISKYSQSVPDVGFKYGANQDGVPSAWSLQDQLLLCQGERRRLQDLTSKAPPPPTTGFQDPRDEQVNDVSRGIIDRLQLCKDERRQLQEQPRDLSKAEANACKKLVLDYLKIKQERKHSSAKARKGKRNPDACHIEAAVEPLGLKK
ncbi:hypothetical protein C4D60_Mb11t01340 [Musa balbisiana]|uniref:Uncharacterized protein n=1 Tax=Musa balbisiana TaxID=52838 RepID=A0A4S8J1S0_MUSBA|nr:hypothetical protein C4D60_Mb11t01340 [Musa balbisiana]